MAPVLSPGARGAFLLQLAAAHRQANCEAWEAMASTARLVVLVDNHRALARRPAIGVSDSAAIPAEITEPFTGAAAELAGRLLRAREELRGLRHRGRERGRRGTPTPARARNMNMACDHRTVRGYTPLLHGHAISRGGLVCVDCGAVGEGSRVPDRAAPASYPEGASWHVHPMIGGREVILLRVGGVKRLAVVWAREVRRSTPAARIQVRVWKFNNAKKSSVAGWWSSATYVPASDEHGPAPWNHPRLFASTLCASWRLEPPPASDETPGAVACFTSGSVTPGDGPTSWALVPEADRAWALECVTGKADEIGMEATWARGRDEPEEAARWKAKAEALRSLAALGKMS